LQTIVDADVSPCIETANARYYDILGFDPRGIGETEPPAYCMHDTATAWSWGIRENTVGLLGSSDASLGRHWSMSRAWGNACKEEMDDEYGPNIKQYMSTAFVARDMLQIAEKHASLVAQTVARLDEKTQKVRVPEEAPVTPSKAKVDYWGFSYGTVLGSTFASMYPDRVGRFILDGVVSSYDYVHALGNGSLTDNQKAMNSFYTYCMYAGCPLAASANSTYSDIEERTHSILQSLYHSPLPLNTTSGPDVLTYSDVKSLIFSSLYSPQVTFPQIAELLIELERGYGSLIDLIASQYQYTHIYSCSREPNIDGSTFTPTFAVLCSDSIDETSLDIKEFAEYWDLLEGLSPAAGAIWSMLRMRCASWKIKASYKYEGPFGRNTSSPILFVSNTADPVTPLRSGRLMHSLFPNSGILVLDQAGHCSISALNVCIVNHIKSYFQTGELPPKDTLCIPPPSPYSLNSTDPNSPFYDPSLGTMQVEQATPLGEYHTEEEAILHRASHAVTRTVAGQDLLGVGRLLGGAGLMVGGFLEMAAQEFRFQREELALSRGRASSV
jgi:pimeloyl-ACP methyl ester carboxylesterase